MSKGRAEPAGASPERLTIGARRYGAASVRGLPFANLLTRKEQRELARIAETVTYARRQSIFKEGDRADYLFVIEQGVVRVSRDLMEGERHVLAFFRPGDLLGLAEEGRYINSAYTLTAVTLRRMHLRSLHELLLSDSQLQLRFLLKAAHELRMAQRQLIVLTRKPPHQRLATFLLNFMNHREYFSAVENSVYLPMTRDDIADYLAIRPETLARAFARLERDGVIARFSPREIRIRNLSELIHLGTV